MKLFFFKLWYSKKDKDKKINGFKKLIKKIKSSKNDPRSPRKKRSFY